MRVLQFQKVSTSTRSNTITNETKFNKIMSVFFHFVTDQILGDDCSTLSLFVCFFVFESLQHISGRQWSRWSSLEKRLLVSPQLAVTNKLPRADVIFGESFVDKFQHQADNVFVIASLLILEDLYLLH